jgi:hypothetical protein
MVKPNRTREDAIDFHGQASILATGFYGQTMLAEANNFISLDKKMADWINIQSQENVYEKNVFAFGRRRSCTRGFRSFLFQILAGAKQIV